ncbi:protein of unknown function DUF583 [Thermobaculum terrenum ATCC BAA-798]|uniref:Polymer-forming cytoskeletal protein n=1 Tax=Thermobaculum terrenum (strain ATCC BAA-798 / CCMEE 7001 / YNP1) TaxID=525904 RepID=D1CFZ6_THET1|nr:polymer-forming cytoskeletal protein [Thermobaculum terrenum]ACZ41852.1 protein of unknown function DUF583 [Thermobaculum terrenum ATCC BAA-798]
MLRRRDLKGTEEGNQQQTSQTEAQNQETTQQSQTQSASSNISPSGLSWRPMRQTNEDWRPQRAGTPTGDESVIGPDDFFSGNYKSERGVRVQGRVEGSIESKGHIFIEEQAQVNADLVAEDITVAGRYNGKVECRRRFEITPTGIVTGEINTDLLVVQEGGYFDGKLKMKDRSGRVAQAQKQQAQGAVQRQGQKADDQSPAQV